MVNPGWVMEGPVSETFDPEHSRGFHDLLEEKLRRIDERIARLESVRALLDKAYGSIDRLRIPMVAQATAVACMLTAIDDASPELAANTLENAKKALAAVRTADIPF